MAQASAHLLLFVRLVDGKPETTAGIYSSRHITLPSTVISSEVLVHTGENFGLAREKVFEDLQHRINILGANAKPWQWLLEQAKRS